MTIDWRKLEGTEKYQAYLASREWGKLRLQVIGRSNGICEHCYRNPATAVHHLTYARIYQETIYDLQAICDDCHAFKHGKTDVDPLVRVIASTDAKVFDELLNCPRCGNDYLHHTYVKVYTREGEDGPIILTTVNTKGEVPQSKLPAKGSENPSSRRHGIAIGFFCENCCGDNWGDAKFELTIAQHKGATYLQWRKAM